jgi:hypothetical protein
MPQPRHLVYIDSIFTFSLFLITDMCADNVYVRKAKVVKAPKLDLSRLLEAHGETTTATGKAVKGGDFVEPAPLASV